MVDLTTSNRFLKQGIVQRKAAKEVLQKSGKCNTQLLAESRQLQKRLRQLTHRIITRVGGRMHEAQPGTAR